MRVLLIDDDVRTSQSLTELLKRNRFGVDAVYSGEEGRHYALSGTYDVIILEKKLPDMSGVDLVQILRKEKLSVPVLFLSGSADKDDIVEALLSGGDDYVQKPYYPEELLARVQVLTRRKGELKKQKLSFSDLVLDIDACEIRSMDGGSLKLSLKELMILSLLFDVPQQVVRKEAIIEKIWGGNSDAEYNNVEVYISFLRKKMEQLGVHTVIRTARGIGYSLEESL